MRYINIEDKIPPENWCEKAKKLTEKLMNARTPEERKNIIDKNNLWNDPEIKNWLLELSHYKCWYSEAKEIYSLYDVDHFRPKKRAKQLDGTEREGYWWLTFDWKNYRISGNIGNRLYTDKEGVKGGKGDYFPLRPETSAATTPSFDVEDEITYMLDPTDPLDPLLLTFLEDGKAYPAVLNKDSWAYERAETTIKILHLNYFLLRDERVIVWQMCNRLTTDIDKLIEEQNSISSATKNEKIRTKIKQLRKMISEEAELSSTARACLLNNTESRIAKLLLAHY